MADVVILDYGMANLRSVQKAFEAVGHPAVITSDPDRAASAEKLVLPGVGALKDAVAELRRTGLDQVICEHVEEGRPFLGICLGLQMLFTRGHEEGLHPALDVFPGEVVRFPDPPRDESGRPLKVPHMGWSTLRLTQPDCPLFRELPPDPAVYFVHSYYAAPTDPRLTAATADYPTPFCAAIWAENVYATQFHPEKSQRVGLRMLKNFAELS